MAVQKKGKKKAVEKASAKPHAEKPGEKHSESSHPKGHAEAEASQGSAKQKIPAEQPTEAEAIQGSAKQKGPAEQPEANIGMVGHVDHGKTSLTLALTGTWTDTHSEELKRGISIRLGYADVTFYKCSHCKGADAFTNKQICPTCGKKAEKLRKVSFVDAPGHETLMTTMLSGAAMMNGAVLVIAANEKCPQPQTEEHLMALKMAGIQHIVVAQNKIDLIEEQAALENKKQASDFLEKNGYKNVPIIPIAANFSINMGYLIEAIEKTIPTPHFEHNKPLLMYCARSFDINRPGAKAGELKGGILGGTIIQGKAVIGEKILIGPGIEGKELEAEIRSLSCSGGPLKEAVPGGLVAIGTGLDPSLSQNDRMRGQVIGTKESLPQAVGELEVEINYLKRVIGATEEKINTGEPIVLTIGTMATTGAIVGMSKGRSKIALKGKVVVLPEQKIAISKRSAGRWQLVAYAEA